MSKSAPHRVPPYKRPILIIGFLVVLAIVVVVTVVIFRNLKPEESSQPSINKPGDSSSATQPSDNTSDDEPENKAPSYEGEDPNLLGELTGRITYIDIDPDLEILHSAVMMDQYLQEAGQCIYNIKRDDAVIRTASAVTANEPSNSVCGPFDISVAGLSGDYQVEVIMTGEGKRGIITTDIQI